MPDSVLIQGSIHLLGWDMFLVLDILSAVNRVERFATLNNPIHQGCIQMPLGMQKAGLGVGIMMQTDMRSRMSRYPMNAL